MTAGLPAVLYSLPAVYCQDILVIYTEHFLLRYKKEETMEYLHIQSADHSMASSVIRYRVYIGMSTESLNLSR